MAPSRFKPGIALVCIVMAAAMTACGGNDANAEGDGSIRVAIFPARSGPLAVVGDAMERGATVAVDHVNAAGGIDGRKVELVTYETDGQPATTLQLVKKAVATDGVELFGGIGTSPEVIAVQPQMASIGALLINSTAKADDILAACDPNTIMTAQTNTMSVRAVTAYLKKDSSVTKWALTATDSPSGRAAVAAFAREIESTGAQVGDPVYVPSGTTDFGSIINSLQQQGADGLFSSIYGSDAVGFLKQAEQFGALDTWSIVAGQSFMSDLLWDAVGPPAEGIINNVTNSPKISNPLMDEFQAAYQKEFDAAPNYIAGEVYLGLETLFAGIDAADSSDASKVLEAIRGTSFDSIVGEVTVREEDGLLIRPDYAGRIVTAGDSFEWEILSTSSGAEIVPPVSGC